MIYNYLESRLKIEKSHDSLKFLLLSLAKSAYYSFDELIQKKVLNIISNYLFNDWDVLRKCAIDSLTILKSSGHHNDALFILKTFPTEDHPNILKKIQKLKGSSEKSNEVLGLQKDIINLKKDLIALKADFKKINDLFLSINSKLEKN
jgi:hypothetical protein